MSQWSTRGKRPDIHLNYNPNQINTSNNISSNCSELIHEITQKEINNNERTFTGTLIYNNSKEINSSGK